jgi:glycosyltransferase involved in cell wall biosynthesis
MAKNSRNILLKLFLSLEALKMKRLESNIFRHVHMGIAVSHTDKQQLKRLCPEAKFEVIENGVDTDKFVPVPDETEDNMLLWVGGFGHYPNEEAVHYLLDKIYPLIKEKINDIKINLVGNNVTNSLKKFLKEDSSINFTGFVDDPIPYLGKAMVFVAPMLSGSGTCLKILEAMAMGKAIVTTSIGCEGIEGLDRKHYMVSDTPEGFTNDVIEIINDKTLRMYLGKNARELVLKKYNWRTISRRNDIIYSILVKQPRFFYL